MLLSWPNFVTHFLGLPRFGTLPAWAIEKITQAQSEQLEQWSLRVLEASTLQEVFTSC